MTSATATETITLNAAQSATPQEIRIRHSVSQAVAYFLVPFTVSFLTVHLAAISLGFSASEPATIALFGMAFCALSLPLLLYLGLIRKSAGELIQVHAVVAAVTGTLCALL